MLDRHPARSVSAAVLACVGSLSAQNLAIEFDGLSYVNCGNDPSLQLFGSMTLEAWLRVDGFSNAGGCCADRAISKGGYGSDDGYEILVNHEAAAGASDFHLGATTGGTGNTSLASPQDFSVGAGWRHVALVQDPAARQVRFYVDGLLEAAVPWTATNEVTTSFELWIGDDPGAPPVFHLKQRFRGATDQVRIWSAARTQAELQATINHRITAADMPQYPDLVSAWNFEGDLLDEASVNDGAYSHDQSLPAQFVGADDIPILFDCNGNGVSDGVEIASGAPDCNGNGVLDVCDIAPGGSLDVDANGIPDECEPDCNGNGVPDAYDIAQGTSPDCNANLVPDECDLAGGASQDLDCNLVPDECQAALTLTVAPCEVSVSAGGTQALSLSPGAAHDFQLYFLLGSASGTSPGIPVDGVVLPLNIPDPYFSFTLNSPNTTLLSQSFGVLLGGGAATASFNIPAGVAPASLVGVTLNHAYLVFDSSAAVVLASNPAPVTLGL